MLALGSTMSTRMTAAGKIWKDADAGTKDHFRAIAKSTDRPTLDTLDSTQKKMYIGQQLVTIQSAV